MLFALIVFLICAIAVVLSMAAGACIACDHWFVAIILVFLAFATMGFAEFLAFRATSITSTYLFF
jgi:hypothetical protein